MAAATVLVRFRADLRLRDNAALAAAAAGADAVVPVFVWSPEEEGTWAPGAASRWWLAQSLRRLDETLRKAGSRLVVRRGPALETLRDLARETGAGALYWNRRYEPAAIACDDNLQRGLAEDGVEVRSFNASLLFEPWTVTKGDGSPYQVFTPFYRACMAAPRPAEPEPAPRRLRAPQRWPGGSSIETLQLEPAIDWAQGMRSAWEPGESGATKALERFVKNGIGVYDRERDLPDREGTSRLSPHLHFGEIGPRQLWQAVAVREEAGLGERKRGGSVDGAAGGGTGASPSATDCWLRQLLWREFAHHLLYWFPHGTDSPLRPRFAGLAWNDDTRQLHAWQRGRTGYPIVDAGMRQLWTTGWMHNRVRMIVASFLTKDLLLSWQHGARWFWDTLVDADLANNTLGWQWSAGCGADAAPFFRIFHPVLQGRKFDPEGNYVRRWVPELAGLDAGWIHEPWRAPRAVLDAAGVALGRTYPEPIVAHESARAAALAAYARISGR